MTKELSSAANRAIGVRKTWGKVTSSREYRRETERLLRKLAKQDAKKQAK